MDEWFVPGKFGKLSDDTIRLLWRGRSALLALFVLPSMLSQSAFAYYDGDSEFGVLLLAAAIDPAISGVLNVLFVATACQVVTRNNASIGASIVWARQIRYRPYIAANFLMVAAILLGFLAFILPGIYAIVALAFLAPVALLEQTGPRRTMDRSIELVRGAFRRTAGPLIGLGLGAVIVVELAIGYFGSGSNEQVHIVDALVAAAAHSFAAAIAAAVIFILYIQRRAEREGLDWRRLERAYRAAAARELVVDLPPAAD